LTPPLSQDRLSKDRVSVEMPKLSSRSTASRPSGGERVFADDKGRLWSAAATGDAVVFACISDGRETGRAIGVEAAGLDDSVGDDTLRAWLEQAPRIGTLP
jgi:hypothetical protein